MATINPNIHIICGKCGCSTMMEYSASIEVTEDGLSDYIDVVLTCNNCHTLTSLNEIIKSNDNGNEL